MRSDKPSRLSIPLEVETFATTPEIDVSVEATTYVTAIAGATCFNGATQCGIQICNPPTEVCF